MWLGSFSRISFASRSASVMMSVRPLTAGEVVVTKLDAGLEIVFLLVQTDGLPQFVDHLGKAFETFEGAGQSPVCGS